MSPRRKRDDLAVMEEVLRSSDGRSPLFRWLRKHHDWFAAQLAGSRPDWQALAEGFGSRLGFTNGRGKPLTAKTARHTWWRVQRAMREARAKRPVPTAPAVRLIAASPAAPPALAPSQAAGGSTPLEALHRMRAEMLTRSGRKVTDAEG